MRKPALYLALSLALPSLLPPTGRPACCYFAAKDADVLQPAQKAFITWSPKQKVETFTVQPKFEGNALDFGMVIPTPGRPKLHEMPRDFFKELAVFSLLNQRQFPESKLVPAGFGGGIGGLGGLGGIGGFGGGQFAGGMVRPRPPAVRVLETGVVGSLDYKIVSAGRADDLYRWLKENKYAYKGDEATLDHYVKKKWYFTAMKIDAMQMKKNKDGSYTGEVTPTRFQFASGKLVYPLKITRLSVKDRTEALFYVQAPYKVDLPGDWTYQFQWIPMLQNAQGGYGKGSSGSRRLPGKGDGWLRVVKDKAPDLLRRGQELGFTFVNGQRPQPNKQGHVATTLEWAKRLTARDILLLQGEVPYTEKLPGPDEGFTQADVNDPKKAEAVSRVIRRRLAWYQKKRPNGYLVREAPEQDVRQLRLLAGHLKKGQFLTKIRKTFTRDEMAGDLRLVPTRVGSAEDWSEYTEVLPTSPP